VKDNALLIDKNACWGHVVSPFNKIYSTVKYFVNSSIFVISLLPSCQRSRSTLSTVASGNSCSKKPHEQPFNSISLHVLGLTPQMMMTRGDPGNCQVTLDHLTLATVLPALCHGLMYVSVSWLCLFPCVYVYYPFLFDFSMRSC
jgi:hypothetical protein